MGIEINTGYSCYLSAARRRQGRIGSGLGGSGMWNRNRDKHWVQLLFISSSSSFFNGQPLSLTMAFAQLSPSLEWSSRMRIVWNYDCSRNLSYKWKCSTTLSLNIKPKAISLEHFACRHSSHSILHEIVTVNGTTAVSNTAQHVWMYAWSLSFGQSVQPTSPPL